MEEIFEVITLRSLGQLHKPAAFLDTEGYWLPAVELLRDSVDKGFAGERLLSAFGYFTDPAACYAEIDRLYERLMQKREGVYADAGLRTVILGGELTGMLSHEAVGHTVEADLVLGGSVAGPCLHKQVASEKVNLTDFAHTAFGHRCPLPVFVDTL